MVFIFQIAYQVKQSFKLAGEPEISSLILNRYLVIEKAKSATIVSAFLIFSFPTKSLNVRYEYTLYSL